MKVAIVVQRYGSDISGGAELHARYVAEHLSSDVDVLVLTTCARDYITWRNELPPGADCINGVRVERFPIAQERNFEDFAQRSSRVFSERHSVQDELDWLSAQGPLCPGLIARLQRSTAEFDFVVLFSARYFHSYHGCRAAADRAVLVPTAEREPAIGLAILQHVFRGVRAIMYNSFEERALIHALAGNDDVPHTVVGIGSDVPEQVEPERIRQALDLHHPFVIYVGRIDKNKGCAELFDFFIRYSATSSRIVDLVLIGTQALPIPDHPRIRHLGYVSDRDKFDTIAAAEALVMPSYYESLSMVALEAWALGRPVVANARCDVLLGQCIRSNAGLYYQDAREFAAVLDSLLDDPTLATALGVNGRTYYRRHYTWPVIQQKYLDMFQRLSSERPARGMEALPGWFQRRRATLPPAVEVLAAAPKGAVRA